MEDKAIEAMREMVLEIRQYLCNTEFAPEPFTEPIDPEKLTRYFPNLLLHTLTSLGYVKQAEQKLPNKFGLGFPLASWNEMEKVQYERGQQDMLKVDSEGCAYRRVMIQEPVKEPCPECGGSGIYSADDEGNKTAVTNSVCPACNGTGRK